MTELKAEATIDDTAPQGFARWWYSLLMLVVYIATFHAWMNASRTSVIVVGLVVCGFLTVLLQWVNGRNYFCNRTDYWCHVVVIVDLLLEALLPIAHDHYGFYLCAIAFAIVIGWYRARHMDDTPEAPISDPTANETSSLDSA